MRDVIKSAKIATKTEIAPEEINDAKRPRTHGFEILLAVLDPLYNLYYYQSYLKH